MANPKAPTGVFTWKRRGFVVVRWNKVTEDVDKNPITPTAYELYRTEKTNLRDLQLIATIVSTDVAGAIDTAYLDMDAYGDQLFFYQLKAKVGMAVGAFSAFAATLHFTDLRDVIGEPALDQFGRWDVSLWDAAVFA